MALVGSADVLLDVVVAANTLKNGKVLRRCSIYLPHNESVPSTWLVRGTNPKGNLPGNYKFLGI